MDASRDRDRADRALLRPLSGNRVVISGAYGCGKKKGVFHWSVAAGRPTLTKLQDSCKWSFGLFDGVWKREKT
jgi:hypothetical protein